MREPRWVLALGGALLAQTIGALLWAGSAAERLAQLETEIDRSAELIERTARLEEQSRHISQSLIRIEKKIDQTGER